jgi:dephospho-CoA kinase
MAEKIILGFTGLPASGKGTAAKYLEDKYRAKNFRFSTMLRDLLNRIYLPQSRDFMIKMSEIIRATYGEDTMAKVIAKDVENADCEVVVVEGIRRMADIEFLKKLPNFVLIEIFADIETRLGRIQKRRENPDDAMKTMDQFKADHQRSTEVTIPEVAGHATERIDNNGSLDDLNQQLDILVTKYGSQN